MTTDERLARLAAIAEDLPEAEWEQTGRHATFRIRRRTFAYFLDDHQGDGIVGLACKAPAGVAPGLIAAEPERYYPPAYLHHRGWIGLRLDRGAVDWEVVEGRLVESYLLTAPKRLAAEVRGG